MGKKLTTNDFICRAQNTHNDTYDYSKVHYKSTEIPVTIVCPHHGEFQQKPHNHLSGCGCPKCGNSKHNRKRTTQEFIHDSNIVHNGKYDYTKTNYISNKINVIITCNIHGDFNQSPNVHLNGGGCPECKKIVLHNNNKSDTNTFIHNAQKIHGDKYDYSHVEYINNRTKVKIYCNTCKSYFYQTPTNHYRQNCPTCSYNDSKGESKIREILESLHIEYEHQYIFKKCKHKRYLPFDFYIPSLNMCIEYDGRQHYEAVSCFGGEQAFKDRQYRDNIKTKYCIDNNIQLLRIPYTQFDNIEHILHENIKKERH